MDNGNDKLLFISRPIGIGAFQFSNPNWSSALDDASARPRMEFNFAAD